VTIYHSKSGTKHRQHGPILIGFLIVTAGVVSLLIYLATRPRPIANLSLESFSNLHQVYREQGIQGFLRQKDALRRLAKEALQLGDDSDAEVENMAVYLFPDVLPEPNLERDSALALWTPHQSAIESAPGTPESRRFFEEMRANIWNYESPSRNNPQLSPPARQVIRIYEVLSAP